MIVRGCDFPEDRRYHADFNVWVQVEARDVVVLGATSFGVALAVDFIAFMPKPIGMAADMGRAVALIELAKTIVSVRTPVGGTIVAANEKAVADPSIIRDDPYGEGWLVRLKVDDWESAGATLLSGAAVGPAFEAEMELENFTGPDRR